MAWLFPLFLGFTSFCFWFSNPLNRFTSHGGHAHLLTVCAVFLVVLSAYALYDLNGHSFDLTDREMMIVVTGSMDGEPQDYDISTIPVRSLVMVEHIGQDEISDLKIGDVVAYYSGSIVIMHRLVEFGDDHLVLKGDANVSSENVPFEDVMGKVVGVSPILGQVFYFIKSSPILVMGAFLCLVIMAYSLRAILRILSDKEESQ